MSEDPYHWRICAADEEKADVVRTLLGMPDLCFRSSAAEMYALLNNPPKPEIQEKLKKMECVMTTNELDLTRISFKHAKYLSDYVLKTLDMIRYALITASVLLFIEMSRSAVQSGFFFG
jgi:hypothetical protein